LEQKNMMTVSKISSAGGAADYFTKDGFGDVLGSDKESLAGEYYTSGTDAGAAQWHGKLADELGLDKVESKEQFNDMLSGKLPNGEELPVGPTGERSAGWDATFSAPKSVSIQGLVGGDERVIKAHDEAVKEALDKFEERASTRVKTNGEVEHVNSRP
jgi:conjugative relaxase-like TrwC/TraI family protein